MKKNISSSYSYIYFSWLYFVKGTTGVFFTDLLCNRLPVVYQHRGRWSCSIQIVAQWSCSIVAHLTAEFVVLCLFICLFCGALLSDTVQTRATEIVDKPKYITGHGCHVYIQLMVPKYNSKHFDILFSLQKKGNICSSCGTSYRSPPPINNLKYATKKMGFWF